MSEDKKSLIDLVPDSVDNAVKNITDKPTQNIGTTLADIWYLVFGGISQAAEKRKLKYSYALQEFEKELKEKISKIPEEKLTDPDIQIIAKALEEAKYCIDKEELRKMFNNLISSSLNIDFCNYIHPSFPLIINQLSIYDAKIFNIIYHNDVHTFTKKIEDNVNNYSEFINKLSSSLIVLRNLGLIFSIKLYTSGEAPTYDDILRPIHLYHIILETLYFEDKSIPDRIEKNFVFQLLFRVLKRKECIDDNLYFVQLSPLGESFGKCCCE